MKLSDYLEDVERIQNKLLVYKEVRHFLEQYRQTDTREPERYIPCGAPTIEAGDISYDKVVPQYVIADVILEIEEACGQINKEIKNYLDREI